MLRLKDIKEKLDRIHCEVDVIQRRLDNRTTYNSYEEYYKKAVNMIENQNKIIENLANILCNKYKHGLFVMSNDGEMPTVIKDGEVITGNNVSSFRVDWSHDGCVSLSVDYK